MLVKQLPFIISVHSPLGHRLLDLMMFVKLNHSINVCCRWSASSSEDGTGHLLGEPLLGIIGGDSLVLTEFTLSVLSLGDSLTSSGEDDVEVHTEDTSVGIVLDTEIDVLLNTKTEVTYNRSVEILEICLTISLTPSL